MLGLLVTVVLAYLIGSIPTAYIVGKLTKGIDIRQHGSGNIGATNTLRVLGKKMGVLVLLADMAKGIFCVLVLPPQNDAIFKVFIAAAVVFGHIWTIFLGFKGGKGIATTLGVFFALTPVATVCSVIIWIIIFKLSRYVSLASLAMMTALPVLIFTFRHSNNYLFLAITLLITSSYTHKSNIKRLISGSENKFTKK